MLHKPAYVLKFRRQTLFFSSAPGGPLLSIRSRDYPKLTLDGPLTILVVAAGDVPAASATTLS